MTYCTKKASDAGASSDDSDSESEADTGSGKKGKWGHVRDLYSEKTSVLFRYNPRRMTCELIPKGLVSSRFPHVGQNLWFYFESVKDVDLVLQNLHPLGIREGSLKTELQKHRDTIARAMEKMTPL